MLTGVLVAILLAMAPAAHAAKGMEISLQDELLFRTGATPFDKARAYSLLDGIQVSRLRFNAIWTGLNIPSQRCQTTKPATPAYDFTSLDSAVAAARARGLKVLISITGPAPAWANKKKSCNTQASNNPKPAQYKPSSKEFARFAKLVATRYKGLADEYSVWNEPNHKSWIQPVKTAGTQYRELYRRAYAAIKKADSKAKVLIGELAPYASKKGVATPPLAFLRQMACVNSSYQRIRGKKCPQLTATGFAMHVYDFARPPTKRYPQAGAVTIANLGSLTSALDKLQRAGRLKPTRGKRMSLYLTEYGYFASRVSKRAKVFKEKTRAKYYLKAFQIAQKNKRVKQMLQFLLVSYPGAGTATAGFNFDTSIVKLDGRRTRSYFALAKWAKKAAKRKLIKPAPTTP